MSGALPGHDRVSRRCALLRWGENRGPFHSCGPAFIRDHPSHLGTGLIDHLIIEHHGAARSTGRRSVVGVRVQDQLGVIVIGLPWAEDFVGRFDLGRVQHPFTVEPERSSALGRAAEPIEIPNLQVRAIDGLQPVCTSREQDGHQDVVVGVAGVVALRLLTDNESAHIDTGHEVGRTENQCLHPLTRRRDLVDIAQADRIFELGLDPDPALLETVGLFELTEQQIESTHLTRIDRLGEQNRVERGTRSIDHRDHVRIRPGRSPIIDPNNPQLISPPGIIQCGDDIGASCGLRIRGHSILQIEENLVDRQALGLFDHLGVAPRHGEYGSARFHQHSFSSATIGPRTLSLTDVAATRVYAARLAGLAVLGPDGESIGRIRDVVVAIRGHRQPPPVHGLVVELPTRRRIFVPMLRVTSIEPRMVTLNSGTVSLRRFAQRSGELLALAQIVDSAVQVEDPELPDLAGVDVFVTDLGIEQARTRDWRVLRVAVRGHRRLGRRRTVHVVDWPRIEGLTPYEIGRPGQQVTSLLEQFEGQRAADVAHQLRELPEKRRVEVAVALDDERLADVIQELSDDEQVDLLGKLEVERAAEVLEAMDPDDTADLLGGLPENEAEALLALMDPHESEPVRRLLEHSPDTAGGLMTPRPVVLTPVATVAEALAKVGNPDLAPALASMVFVVRPPTATPTGRYLGCVLVQQLLREPPAHLVSAIIDDNLASLRPEVPLAAITRYFATYNLVCGPVVDAEGHLLGAVSVDDVLDHLLPPGWREEAELHEGVGST